MKTHEADIHFPSHYTRAHDGTRLRYFDTGGDLPAVVLANGLGGPIVAWKPYLARWREKYRVITWDYRGLYGSTLPARDADLSIESHASDLRCVLDAAGISRAAILGWSMGVQVGLEFYSQSPQRVSKLALLNGTFGKPLRGVPLPFSGLALPRLVKGAQKAHFVGTKILHGLSRSRMSYGALRKLRVIAPGLTESHFHAMIGEFKSVDLEIYFDLLARLGEHDAEAQLRHVRIPTLVITGSRDILTPPSLARKIAAEVPNSELFVITGATHYAAAEYPEIVASRVEKFFGTGDAFDRA